MTETACIFCDIIAGEAPASFVYDEGDVVAFMDIQPVHTGHLLVVPRAHAAHLADLDPTIGGRLFQVAMELATAVRRSGVRCEGIDLFLADGAAAGQEVYHVHLHVLPRYRGDGFGFRFGPDAHKMAGRESLDEVAAAIRAARAGAEQGQG